MASKSKTLFTELIVVDCQNATLLELHNCKHLAIRAKNTVIFI